jgi:hypothetical protein
MARPKRKTLPKDFETRIGTDDLEALKKVFADCDVDARGGAFKQTAIAFADCPDDLTRWLVANGADVSAQDAYGETPLHARAGHWNGRIDILLELGADMHSGEGARGTPLHNAAAAGNARNTQALLDHGARVDALNSSGQTPLVHALERCTNAKIEGIAEVAALLVAAAASAPAPARTLADRFFGRAKPDASGVTSAIVEHVQRIGTDFEFHRAGFNPDSVNSTSAALERLTALFGVPPIPRRVMHDGKEAIVAAAKTWEDRHQQLWELLVPSSGPADTVQGEVIRISGRIAGELDGNGGINWDADFKTMADHWLTHVASGTPLGARAMAEARTLVAAVKKRQGEAAMLCALSVEWVALNPEPLTLAPPPYRR